MPCLCDVPQPSTVEAVTTWSLPSTQNPAALTGSDFNAVMWSIGQHTGVYFQHQSQHQFQCSAMPVPLLLLRCTATHRRLAHSCSLQAAT